MDDLRSNIIIEKPRHISEHPYKKAMKDRYLFYAQAFWALTFLYRPTDIQWAMLVITTPKFSEHFP